MVKCNAAAPPTSWADVISTVIQHWQKKTMLASLCCLVFGATIYNLWRNCNEIRHGGLPLTEEKLEQKIHRELRTRVAGKESYIVQLEMWIYAVFGAVLL